MSSRDVSVSRATLYEQVWKTPIQKLAKEYGLSDVGLSKACRTHRIPTPPRGHWAKLAAGKRVTKEPLPRLDASEKDLVTVTFRPDEYTRAPDGIKAAQTRALEREATRAPIMIGDDDPLTHPLTKALSREYTVRERRENRDRVYGETPISQVSKAQRARALRLLDRALTEAEARRWKQETSLGHPQWRGYPQVQVQDTFWTVAPLRMPIRIWVTESRVAVHTTHKTVPFERTEWRHTGELSLHASADGYYPVKVSDNGPVRVEDQLSAFLTGCIKRAGRERRRAFERAVFQRDWKRKERRRAQLEKEAAEREARIRSLRRHAKANARTRRLVRFLARLDRQARAAGVRDEPRIDAWFAWATSYVGTEQEELDRFLKHISKGWR